MGREQKAFASGGAEALPVLGLFVLILIVLVILVVYLADRLKEYKCN